MISDFFQVLFEIAYNRVHFLTYGNPAFLVYAGVVLVSLVLWRLWRFTILPATRPNEPKELPYWVPVIGHARAFFKDSQALLTHGRRYFKDTREPFSITVAGQQLYIVTSPRDMASVYKNSSTLSFDSFVHDLDAAFGMSAGALSVLFDTSSGKCLSSQTSSIYGAQLHPGEHLEDLTLQFVSRIAERLTWACIPDTHAILDQTKVTQKTVSLYGWCADVLVPSATEGFFGPALLKLDSNFIQDYHDFDNDSWMLTYRYPRFLARKLYTSLDRNTAAFTRYVQLAPSERPGACYYVHHMTKRLREADIPDRDMAIVLQMFYWVTNANAYKVAFWLLAYLLHSPTTLAAIRAEVTVCIANNQVSIAPLTDSCPVLNASFDETLRLTSAASSARTVLSPTEIGGKLLRKDTKVLLPYRQLHFQELVFGPCAADEFHPERFLENEELAKSPSYKPFGGGVTYCSGRFIARREVLAFVALVISRYDLEVVKDKGGIGGVPRYDEQKPTLGVVGPMKGNALMVTVKKRDVEM